MFIFGSFLMAFSVLSLAQYSSPLVAVIPMFVVGSMVAFSPVFVSWLYGSYAPSKSQYVGATADWTISEDRLHCDVAGTEVAFGWDRVLKVSEYHSGFLIYTGPAVAHWIPRHGFESDDDVVSLISFLQSRKIACTKVP